MRYGKVLDDITVEQANEIVDAKNIGIVICRSKLNKEVKDIFKGATDIAVYENVSDKDVEEAFKKLNDDAPKFINEKGVIPGGRGESIYPVNNTIRLNKEVK